MANRTSATWGPGIRAEATRAATAINPNSSDELTSVIATRRSSKLGTVVGGTANSAARRLPRRRVLSKRCADVVCLGAVSEPDEEIPPSASALRDAEQAPPRKPLAEILDCLP